MNAVQAAETSGDQELICTAYTTAVLHMRDKVKFFSYILQVDLMFIFTIWIAVINKIMAILLFIIVQFLINHLNVNHLKSSNTFKQFVGKLPTNYLNAFDHFLGLVLKGLNKI